MSARSIATQGIGFAALSVALLGFVDVSVGEAGGVARTRIERSQTVRPHRIAQPRAIPRERVQSVTARSDAPDNSTQARTPAAGLAAVAQRTATAFGQLSTTVHGDKPAAVAPVGLAVATKETADSLIDAQAGTDAKPNEQGPDSRRNRLAILAALLLYS